MKESVIQTLNILFQVRKILIKVKGILEEAFKKSLFVFYFKGVEGVFVLKGDNIIKVFRGGIVLQAKR